MTFPMYRFAVHYLGDLNIGDTEILRRVCPVKNGEDKVRTASNLELPGGRASNDQRVLSLGNQGRLPVAGDCPLICTCLELNRIPS